MFLRVVGVRVGVVRVGTPALVPPPQVSMDGVWRSPGWEGPGRGGRPRSAGRSRDMADRHRRYVTTVVITPETRGGRVRSCH